MWSRAQLKAMPGDQWRALSPLLSHPNVQVRLKAAHSVLALYPDLARKALEDIRDSGIEPQNEMERLRRQSGVLRRGYIPK